MNQLVIPRTNDEVGRLGEQLNAMAEKLESRGVELKKILEEKAISESIVQSMDDALMLIDRFGRVLSINRSAQELFRSYECRRPEALDVALINSALNPFVSWRSKGAGESDRSEIVEYERHGEHLYLTRDIIPIQSEDSPGTVAFLLVLRNAHRPMNSIECVPILSAWSRPYYVRPSLQFG